jgi:hypothetical protein
MNYNFYLFIYNNSIVLIKYKKSISIVNYIIQMYD